MGRETMRRSSAGAGRLRTSRLFPLFALLLLSPVAARSSASRIGSTGDALLLLRCDRIDRLDPYVRADTLPDTVTTIHPTVTCTASVMPHLNQIRNESGAFRNRITFNTIEHVRYRIDDMRDEEGNERWLYADPPGGFGDDAVHVALAFLPDSLYSGTHTITILAENSAGNRTGDDLYHPWSQRIFVKAIALHDLEAEPDYDGRIRLSYRIRGGTFGAEARIVRVAAGGSEEVLASFPLADGATNAFFDRRPRPGERYTYRIEASALGETWSWETDLVAPAPIVRGKHLSRVTPNPFRGRTVISFRVPRGDRADPTAIEGKPDDADGTPPPGGEGAPRSLAGGSVVYRETRVEIDIFNVAGRLVRSFPHVHSLEGFYDEPIIWDGADDSGRALPAGVYFVRMRAGSIRESRKVILLP